MKFFLAALAFALVGGTAQAATILPVNLSDTALFESSRQLFGVEIKRDQNVQNSGGSGKDAFLRDGTDTNTSGVVQRRLGRVGHILCLVARV